MRKSIESTVFIATKQPQILKNHIIAQNNRENQNLRDSGMHCEIQRSGRIYRSQRPKMLEFRTPRTNSKQPQILKYHIITQNNRENQNARYSDMHCEIQRRSRIHSSYRPKMLEFGRPRTNSKLSRPQTPFVRKQLRS